MDIQQLRALREVARRRSFSGAAKELFVSQPAVSRQISSLEAEIGMPLFVRMGNHIVLTDPGRKLLVYAEEILQTLEQAMRTLQNLQDLRQGMVTVAADAYLSKYFLPRFAGEFNRRYPGLQLRVLTYPQDKLPEILADGRADLAYFCGEPGEDVLLTQEQICLERLCFVAPGPIGADIEANIKEYTPFIYPPDVGSLTNEYRKVLPQDMNQADLPLVIESLEGIKTVILSGTGCSILPENLIRVEMENGYLHVFPIGLSCPVIMTYPKNARLPHPVLLFMGLIRKTLF
ncbi:MAG: LysR family transcriptional regulator [Desulfitobacteriaceae bacterium]